MIQHFFIVLQVVPLPLESTFSFYESQPQIKMFVIFNHLIVFLFVCEKPMEEIIWGEKSLLHILLMKDEQWNGPSVTQAKM